MLIFIDDSGDPGFKLGGGSTNYFVIVLVIFHDPLEAEKTALAIKKLRRELGFSHSEEFKFFKSRKEVRIKFLTAINQYDFKIRSLVVNKSVIRSHQLQTKKDKFYAYFIKEVLKHSDGSILEANIKIDGSGGR